MSKESWTATRQEGSEKLKDLDDQQLRYVAGRFLVVTLAGEAGQLHISVAANSAESLPR